MSYSQYDEEKYILEAFGDKIDGTFLDIGAWHPTKFSNTRALYELGWSFECGWSGVMIEPSPGPMLSLLKEYSEESRIILVQAAVGIEPGLAELHVTDDAVSTLSCKEYQRWKETTEFHGSVMVPTITLEDIGNRFGGFDFVNIDAEGLSVDLFNRLLTLGWEPHCICVEHDSRLEELASVATRIYQLVYANGTNAVWVRK